MHIHRKIAKLKYICAVCFSEPYTKSQISTDSSSLKVGQSSTKTQRPLNHSVDTKCFFLHVKFKGRLVISSTRKSMFNKKYHYSGEMVNIF
jgi:hypothetical protein